MQILSLILGALAVARFSMLFVDDRLLLGLRQWAIKKWGVESLPAYFVLCNWCMSIWIAFLVMPVAALWPNKWVIAALSIPAASLVTGFLSKVRG